MDNENHPHSGDEDDLIVVTIVKGKGMERVGESDEIKELSKSGKKFKMSKTKLALLHIVVKYRGIIIENCFSKESLT